MEWLLFIFIPIFVLLAIRVKPLYFKLYDDVIDMVHNKTYDPRLDAYLQRIADEATRDYRKLDGHRERMVRGLHDLEHCAL